MPSDDFVGPPKPGFFDKVPGGLGGFTKGLGVLGGILENFFGPSQADLAGNRFKQGATDFLARGGGQELGADAMRNAVANFNNIAKGYGSLFDNQQIEASEGRGPGGGLGVYKNVDQYWDENQPQFKEKGFASKLGGALSSIF